MRRLSDAHIRHSDSTFRPVRSFKQSGAQGRPGLPARLARVAVSEGFITGLPKAELHVHHVGSVPLRAVAELAARHPGTVPSDPSQLATFFVFDDLSHFIRNYLAVVDLIKT